MMKAKTIKPNPKDIKRVDRITAVAEKWETKEQCYNRIKKEFNVSDQQIENGKIIIVILSEP